MAYSFALLAAGLKSNKSHPEYAAFFIWPSTTFGYSSYDDARSAYYQVHQRAETFNPANWNDDKIEAPLQVILAKSPFWNAEYEQFVRQLAPQVDYRVMEGVGHFLMMEKPKEFNELMAGFLKKEGLLKR